MQERVKLLLRHPHSRARRTPYRRAALHRCHDGPIQVLKQPINSRGEQVLKGVILHCFTDFPIKSLAPFASVLSERACPQLELHVRPQKSTRIGGVHLRRWPSFRLLTLYWRSSRGQDVHAFLAHVTFGATWRSSPRATSPVEIPSAPIAIPGGPCLFTHEALMATPRKDTRRLRVPSWLRDPSWRRCGCCPRR